jgi:hypothetical protein
MTPWRQLDLLKDPRRQRGTRPPAATEFATHCAIADTIRVNLAPGWLWFHCPNGELRPDGAGARLKRMGTRPGVSDFLLVAPPRGRLHALELKRRGERPTNAQHAFLADLADAGGLSAWVDSYGDAIEQLKAWGALKRSIEVAA